LLFEQAFPNHPYGLPQEGREETITKLGREHLFEWREATVRPENLVIGVVGDIDTREVVERFQDHLGQLSPTSPGAKPGAENNGALESDSVGENLVEREKAQTALALGFRTPGYRHEDFYALVLIQNITSGLGGRFFDELREKQALAYTVNAFEMARGSAGLYVAYIATSPDQEARARGALWREFQKLREEPVTAEELQRSKNYTIGTYEIGLETNAAQLSEYVRNEILGKGVEAVSCFAERIEAVSRDKVLQVAQKYFDPRRYALGGVRGKAPGSPS